MWRSDAFGMLQYGYKNKKISLLKASVVYCGGYMSVTPPCVMAK